MTSLNLPRAGSLANTKSTEYRLSPNSESLPVPFAARYSIEAPLGHGTASVFRAKDLKTGVCHAVKRLPPDAALEPGEHERFINEVSLLSQLCHPNIVAMKELHRDDAGRSCLVMELLDGEDALLHLAGGQRLNLPRVLEITRQVTSALHAAHRSGITHREFELSSIFLAMQRGPCKKAMEVVKVVGFGGVKLRTLSSEQLQDCSTGTAGYLAPEAMIGPRSELDARSDQWSVAVTVYRMLSGRLPFQADDAASLRLQICTLPPEPLMELCPELPPHVSETLDRALAKDKMQRFPSLAEFMRALSGQAPPRAKGAGRSVVLTLPPPASLAQATLAGARAPSSTEQKPTDGLSERHPSLVSEIPTIALAVDAERTQTMEPAMLELLRAQSQNTEQPGRSPRQSAPLESSDSTVPQPTPMPPLLKGARLMQKPRRGTPWQQALVLIICSCIGLSLGMSAAWLVSSRASRHLPTKALPIAAPGGQSQRHVVASATARP